MDSEKEDIGKGIGDSSLAKLKVKQGKSWFFGIGINAYTKFSPLNNAVRDMEDICKLLQSKYDIDHQYTTQLINEAATRKVILRNLERLKNSVEEQDKLIIYYSGHGVLSKEDRGFWVPIHAIPDLPDTCIRFSTIREYLADIPALHILVISDACFSGALLTTYRGSSEGLHRLANQKSRWAFCSGRNSDLVADGIPGQHSPFAASILHFLSINTMNVLPISRLVVDVQEATKDIYRKEGGQLAIGGPTAGVGDKGGQYVFTIRNPQKKTIIKREVKNSKRTTSLENIEVALPLSSEIPFAHSSFVRAMALVAKVFGVLLLCFAIGAFFQLLFDPLDLEVVLVISILLGLFGGLLLLLFRTAFYGALVSLLIILSWVISGDFGDDPEELPALCILVSLSLLLAISLKKTAASIQDIPSILLNPSKYKSAGNGHPTSN